MPWKCVSFSIEPALRTAEKPLVAGITIVVTRRRLFFLLERMLRVRTLSTWGEGVFGSAAPSVM
jgi:hypothetical protein